MKFKITKNMYLFMFILIIGLYTSLMPTIYDIPERIGSGYSLIQFLIFICSVLSGLNVWEDVKNIIGKRK